MVKNIIISVLGIASLGAIAFFYNEGDSAVRDTSIAVQQQTLITEALNVLENYKESDNIKYYISRQYELPDQTLWEINIQKYGAKQTCSILEMHPETNLKVDSNRLNEATDALDEKGISYEVFKTLQ